MFNPLLAAGEWNLNLNRDDERRLAQLLLSLTDEEHASWPVIMLKAPESDEPKVFKDVPVDWISSLTSGEGFPDEGILTIYHLPRAAPIEEEEADVPEQVTAAATGEEMEDNGQTELENNGQTELNLVRQKAKEA